MSVVVNGGTAQVFGLTPSTNANCTSSGGATTCANLQAVAPPGTDSFVFTMYADALPLPASPTELSTATVPNQVVAQGVANQLGTFTLNPVVGSIAMSFTEPSGGFVVGTPSSGNAINLTVKDRSGATIIGPGKYVIQGSGVTPVSLTSTQTPFMFSVDGATAAATGSLVGPSDTATLSYTGASVNAITTIEAAIGSYSSSQTISALTAPITSTLSSSASAADYHITTSPAELDFYETGINGTVALAESGYSGSFTLQSTTCGSWVTFSPTTGNSATSFTATAASAGTSASPALCTATFTDSYSQTLSVSFSVTTISFGLQ